MLKFLKNLFSGGIGSAFNSGFGALIGRLVLGKERWNSYLDAATGAQLTGAQEQQNEYNAMQAELARGFTAEQADISRDFNAEQAAIQRDWQAQMDNTKYQRTMDDMRAAGLNPALMYGGASVSSPPAGSAASSSVASGASASGGLPSPSNLGALLQLMQLPLTFRSLKADVEQKEQNVEESKQKVIESKQSVKESESRERVNNAIADLRGMEIGVFDKLTDAQLRDIDSIIASREVQNRLNEQGIKESVAREALATNQAVLAHMDEYQRQHLIDLEVKYREAVNRNVEQHTSESISRQNYYGSLIVHTYQDAILKGAQAGYYNAAEDKVLRETGLLDYDEQQKKFIVSHQETDRMIRIAFDAIDAATDLVKSGAAVYGAGKIGTLPRSMGERPSLLVPGSTSFGGMNYNVLR